MIKKGKTLIPNDSPTLVSCLGARIPHYHNLTILYAVWTVVASTSTSSLLLSSQQFSPFDSYYHRSCKRVAHQLFPLLPSSYPILLFHAPALLEACCPSVRHIRRVAVGLQHARPRSSPLLAIGRARTAGTAQIKMGKNGSGRLNRLCCCQECAACRCFEFNCH
jgi:hypothetical protein